MALVAFDPIGADASAVTEPRDGLGLALRSLAGLAFARDDLERDLPIVDHVPGKPDRAGATAPERTDGTVAAEDQIPARAGGGRGSRHRSSEPWPRRTEVLPVRPERVPAGDAAMLREFWGMLRRSQTTPTTALTCGRSG